MAWPGLGNPRGPGGPPPPPRPINFISWEGLKGRVADVSKIGLNLTDIVLFFRQFAIFAYTLGPLALGSLFRKGLQGLVPPLGTHFSRPGLGQVNPSAFQ